VICHLLAGLLVGAVLEAEPVQRENPELEPRLDANSPGLPFIAEVAGLLL